MTECESFKAYLFDSPSESFDSDETMSLWDAIERNPNESWDFYKLSKHPQLTWDYVMQYSHKQWDWKYLSKHPSLSFEDVRRLPDKHWDWCEISDHPNISLKTISEYPDYFWNFTKRVVPVEILEKTPRYRIYPDRPTSQSWVVILGNTDICWDWKGLSKRSDLSWDTVLENPYLPWDWKYLSRRYDFTKKIVESLTNRDCNWEYDWDWKHLTRWLRRDFAFLLKFPNKPWDFSWLSRYVDIDWDVFWALPHPYGGWDYPTLYTRTKNIDLLLKLPDVPWEFKKSNVVKTLSWDIIERCMKETNGRIRFPWRELSARKDIPWGLIVETRDAWPWCWRTLSGYPRLNFRFYISHPEYPWSHAWVRARFKGVAARRIQGQWRRCVANPAFMVCRRRLLYEYDALCQ
jgi:hypothetical protein